MGTKNNPGNFDCYQAADPDEPMFVLLARDKHAAALVWLWSALREIDGENPEKVKEARDCMAWMIKWASEHDRKSVGVGEAVLAGVLELIRAANYGVAQPKNTETTTDILRKFLCQTTFESSST